MRLRPVQNDNGTTRSGGEMRTGGGMREGQTSDIEIWPSLIWNFP